MSEWWTYSLSDFLLFSPRTYYRLFELYNLAIWPTQLAALALGAAILVMLRTRAAWQGRVIMAVLALVWLWVAWAYFLERYETINWAASYFAAGFAVEAALLVCVGGFRQVSFRLSQNASRAGLAISAFAMFLYPLTRSASTRGAKLAAGAGPRKPMRATFVRSCARASRGEAAAVPRNATTSRRLMSPHAEANLASRRQ